MSVEVLLARFTDVQGVRLAVRIAEDQKTYANHTFGHFALDGARCFANVAV
jgi:hypothetical protein